MMPRCIHDSPTMSVTKNKSLCICTLNYPTVIIVEGFADCGVLPRWHVSHDSEEVANVVVALAPG